MVMFSDRLNRERRDISQVEILGKFASAVRKYNAHAAAYTNINWPQVTEQFVVTLGLSFNSYVTQIFGYRLSLCNRQISIRYVIETNKAGGHF
uniref:Adenylosuccinate lyase n=1 Tax=Tanacetum cinerariifolium TaxID=118510 RepID=A0A6L2MU14_TANCI|nr:adenylosuccinate lyase [Tanacetum cinerariifolium]